MSLPKVSILIPCYNAKQWVDQAITSALEQTYASKEVIVIDDGSTDGSLAIIRQFEERIIWRTQTNQGGNATRNHLLTLSSGDWLQYLDADDYLLPNKIEQQMHFLAQHPAVDVVYSPSRFEYGQGTTAYQVVFPIPEPHDPWSLLARWYLPQTGAPLWRKQAILDVGGWKLDQPCCQEHELYLRLLMAEKQFAYFPEADSIYRQWSETTVCKRNQGEVFRQRLAIEQRLETYLKNMGMLTLERQYAINQARFECARKIWCCDRTWASQILQTINHGDTSFCPSGDAAPRFYRLVYRLFGFDVAEQLAAAKRKIADLVTPQTA
jgi:glycosyltransferase involved in cell wall biosynthesis